MSTAEERRWFSAIASLETCQLCKAPGMQVAHRDFGKGMGLKTPAYMTTYLCYDCHSALTDSKNYSRDEKRALMDRAIVNGYARLIERGQLILRK